MEKLLTFNEWLKNKDEKFHEGIFDTVKKYGRNAALTGAMMGGSLMGSSMSGSNQPQISPQFAQQQIDNHSTENGKLSPEQWQSYAAKYPSKGNGVGFIPHPKIPGKWIPANGADSVRVQSTTQINNDNLTQDDIGLTPYKNGKSMGPTNVSSLR